MVKSHSVQKISFVAAAFFGYWAVRGSYGSNPIDPDAARHMLNGAFLYDLFRTGHFVHPVAFAQSWYARFPALSLPYHPPVFPLMESAFDAVLGVHYWVARLAVGLCVALSVVVIGRLAASLGASPWLSLSAILVFFSSAPAQSSASEVMLEFPATLFAFLSLYPLCRLALRDELTWLDGLRFALLAAIAIWTKQNTAFLVAVPWFIVLLNGAWPIVRKGPIWVCTLLPAAAFAVLTALPHIYGIGLNGNWRHRTLPAQILHHLLVYAASFRSVWGWNGWLLAAALVGYFWMRWMRRHGIAATRPASLFLAAATAAFVLHLLIPPCDARYAVYWYPALVLFVLLVLGPLLTRWFRPVRVDAGIAVASLLFFGLHIAQPVTCLYGVDAAARSVVSERRTRVVFIGPNNGAFIAAIRAADPALRTTVIRADKLPPALLSADFFRRYGISWIAVAGDVTPPAVSALPLAQTFPVHSSDARQGVFLLLYQFPDPSPNPENILEIGSTFSASGLHLVLP